MESTAELEFEFKRIAIQPHVTRIHNIYFIVLMGTGKTSMYTFISHIFLSYVQLIL
jgi:hypothetical protein